MSAAHPVGACRRGRRAQCNACSAAWHAVQHAHNARRVRARGRGVTPWLVAWSVREMRRHAALARALGWRGPLTRATVPDGDKIAHWTVK